MINESVVVFVGEPVASREDITVIIDCSDLIHQARDYGIKNPNVNWYKDGNALSNGSAINVLISEDRSLCIVLDILIAIGAMAGTDGNYTCEVCPPGSFNCTSRSTWLVACGK